MSDSSLPSTARRLTPEQRGDKDLWVNERRRHYPTAKNKREREEAKRRLQASGAYTSPPEANRFKRGFTQQLVEQGGRTRVVLTEKPPSLLDRLMYASVHNTDSLVLEMLTFLRDTDWLAQAQAQAQAPEK